MGSFTDSDEATITNAPLPWEQNGIGADSTALHLVLAWSLEEPHRTGECSPLLAPRVVGRGGQQPGDPAPRAQFFRLRPGYSERTPGLMGSRISRTQFLVQPSEDGLVEVRNLGRCTLLHNGVEIDRAKLRDGDTLTLKNAAVFFVESRPKTLPKLSYYADDGDFVFGRPDPDGMVGESPAMWLLRDRIAFAARSDRHLLLLGDSGVGKELAARAAHRQSPRGNRPLVSRNAATFPMTLLDSELFGCAKNYPNVGSQERVGLIGEADGSNLFLDEIGELPADQQAHLLRVLDAGGEYHRLGESNSRMSRFRLYAATNRSLGSLKHDFLARFGSRVNVQGLNERRSDIPSITMELLRQARKEAPDTAGRFFDRSARTSTPRMSPSLVEALLQHEYTHHVRELERLLWLSMSTSPAEYLALTPEVKTQLGLTDPEEISENDGPTMEEIERALAAAGGSRDEAAQLLGLKSRYALYRLMKKRKPPRSSRMGSRPD